MGGSVGDMGEGVWNSLARALERNVSLLGTPFILSMEEVEVEERPA